MARNKKHAVLLLGLSILLLYLVSARVGQLSGKENPDKRAGIEDAESIDNMLPEETAGPVSEITPEPSPEIVLPDVDTSSWELKLVNNSHVLSSSFAPDVTETENGQYFDSRAVDALSSLLQGARDAGFEVCIRAAYRPYSTQAYIFYGKASGIAWDGTVEYAKAEEMARKIVAYPGTSDHQLGLSADIMDKAETTMSAEDVEDMPLLVWLREHCAEYGFILRYPKDKKDITGWYEPWHFRYVGTEAASYIMENGLCLEEFLDLYH